ncbi:DUF6233 domain-containing protein [Streptomyces sp. NPDC059896]|uniref:DUF6233 domain-containing protein n=1 Tax=Streptomyces sp. NPDC059896 TaxID=3346993 RepID=UPI00365414C5
MEGGGTAPGRRRGVVAVHQGDCGMGKGPGCTRDEARRMLADGVEACIHFPIESSCCSLLCCARRDACWTRFGVCTG